MHDTKQPKYCPHCRANVYPGKGGICVFCDTQTVLLPEKRREWRRRLDANHQCDMRTRKNYYDVGDFGDG